MKIGDKGEEVFLCLDPEAHNHAPSLEQNRVLSIIENHKQSAVNNAAISPRQVFANIMSDIETSGGGYVHVKQVLLFTILLSSHLFYIEIFGYINIKETCQSRWSPSTSKVFL